jgi:HlyD family secretion protein
MRRKIVIPVIVLVLAGAAVAIWLLSRGESNPNQIRVYGNIEVVDVALSFRLGGWVSQRFFDEGQRVRAGDVVATLDCRELAAEVAVRTADLLAAEAALAELRAGTRPEEVRRAQGAMDAAAWQLKQLQAGSREAQKQEAQAAVEAARAQMENRQAEFDRVTKLHAAGAAGQEELLSARYALETAKARVDQALAQQKLVEEGPRKEEIEQAQHAYEQAKAAYEQARNGPRKEDIAAAAARVQQAQAARRQAEIRLSYCDLMSPITGVVLSKNLEVGEYASPGTPVLTIGDVRNVYLRAYVDERDLPRVTPGMAADVFVDAFKGKAYPGTVSFVAQDAEFTPRNVQTEKERVKLVYRIKIDVDNPRYELKPGMPAEAVLHVAQPPLSRPAASGPSSRDGH